ncbi:hypothetical protein J4426_03045 [Candidatus Woesearchaeota archaeon]|nr:hypothetical protein [Candidatus Woesearchaeota archaeon]
MGSGKKNYKNRPKKFSLGAYKPDKEHKEVDKEDLNKLLQMWENQKKKVKKPNPF